MGYYSDIRDGWMTWRVVTLNYTAWNQIGYCYCEITWISFENDSFMTPTYWRFNTIAINLLTFTNVFPRFCNFFSKFTEVNIGLANFIDANIVWCRYNAVNVLPNPHNRHSIARPLSRYIHDDVIKWKHFPRYWPFVPGIHRSTANSPRKGQWGGALMFSLICARINSWVNNREAGDLRHQRGNYDVIVVECFLWIKSQIYILPWSMQ